MKRKISVKKIICLALVGVLSLGVIGGISSFVKKDTKTISSSMFSRGGLDENGVYVESKQTLYTKEAFDCIGLRVVPEFDASLSYDVYYYDYNDNLVDKKLGLTKTYDEDFPLARTCRIVIHPDIAEENKKDYKIAFYEVYGIASKLKITVDKNQSYLYSNSINLFDASKITKNKTFHNGVVGIAEWNTLDDNLVSYGNCNVSERIAVTGEYKFYDIFIRCKEADLPPDSVLSAVIANVEGEVLKDSEGEYAYMYSNVCDVSAYVWHKITIAVPDVEGVDHLRVSLPSDTESCYIFGYND